MAFVTKEQQSHESEAEERISLADPEQVRRWAVKLGVTVEHLRELIAQLGPRVSDLQQRVSQPERLD